MLHKKRFFDDKIMNEEMNNQSQNAQGMIRQFEAFLDEYMVKKVPFHIPQGGKDFLVKVAPYLILIFSVLSIPVILAALGISMFATPFMMLGGYGYYGVLGFVIGLLTLIVMIMQLTAVSGLFARSRKAWTTLYHVSLIELLINLISWNVVGGIIGSIIGWYILFQVKSEYKN